MKEYIIATIALATLLTDSVTFTAYEDIDDVHELSLNRLLSPTSLIGRTNSKVNITASWDAMDNATTYIIKFHKEDPNCGDTPVLSRTIKGTKFTKKGLEDETEYTTRVKSTAEGLNDSKWSVISHTTEVIEQILKAIEDTSVNNKTAAIKWTAGEAITELQLSWTDKGKRTQETVLKISEAEVAVSQKVLADLIPSTACEIGIRNDKKTHGIRTLTTKADLATIVQVHNGDDLTAILDNTKEGAYVTIMDNAEHTIYAPNNDARTYTLNKSLTTSGYYSSNKPTIGGYIAISSSVRTLELSNVILNGEKKADGLLIMGKDPARVETFKVNGCGISDYKNSVINNESKVNIGSITIQNSTISNIGRSVIGIHGDKLKSIKVSACTFNNTARTFLRNSSSFIATTPFTQYTFCKVCHLDNKDNNGLFLMDKTTDNSELIVGRYLFCNIGMEGLEGNKHVDTWTRNDKMKASETYVDNYYYDSPNSWTNSKYAKDYSMVATEASLQFIDAEDGSFTVGSKELVGSEIGDPCWLKQDNSIGKLVYEIETIQKS